MYGRSFKTINFTTPKVAKKEATGQIIRHSEMGYVHSGADSFYILFVRIYYGIGHVISFST